MKKTKKDIVPILIFALICALFTACSGGSDLTITVVNKLDYTIEELYIKDTYKDSWGRKSVLGDDALENKDKIEVSVKAADSSEYDIMAMDSDGDYYFFYELPLSKNATVKLVSTEDGYEAVVSPKKGDTITVEGEFEFGDSGEIAAPAPDDPLDASIALPGYESLLIPYPSTMQVIVSSDRFLQIDAINDPDNHNVIMVDLVEIQGTYDTRLSAADTAQTALVEISQKICDIQFPGQLISSVGTAFVDGGTYYSALYYVWLSGEVFSLPAETPVRGVIECRYYGNTGYILALTTLADEGVFQNYFSIASNMFNAISFGSGWTTPDTSGSGTKWSDPGDYYYGYNPWSDPGDYGEGYGDYFYDDEWYEPNDYDPWSDPGDYYYDDGEYYYDDGDYYYDDGEWYESNDYDF